MFGEKWTSKDGTEERESVAIVVDESVGVPLETWEGEGVVPDYYN